jgi:hypothetical protein
MQQCHGCHSEVMEIGFRHESAMPQRDIHRSEGKGFWPPR